MLIYYSKLRFFIAAQALLAKHYIPDTDFMDKF